MPFNNKVWSFSLLLPTEETNFRRLWTWRDMIWHDMHIINMKMSKLTSHLIEKKSSHIPATPHYLCNIMGILNAPSKESHNYWAMISGWWLLWCNFERVAIILSAIILTSSNSCKVIFSSIRSNLNQTCQPPASKNRSDYDKKKG